MSKDKLNLAGALSQRRALPPIQRGKGVQISTDEQESTLAISPNSDLAKQQIDDPANQQSSDLAIMPDSKTADQQNSNVATQQDSELAKQQISDLAAEQNSTLAKSQDSEIAVVQSSELAIQQDSNPAIQQDSKTAISPNSEVKRVNRGVTLPDDLFQEYKLYGVMLRVSMHRLMEEALTAYLPELRSRVDDNH